MTKPIKPTAKGKYILSHGAPEGFVSEDPVVKQDGKSYIKYDKINVEPKSKGPFYALEMQLSWKGHVLFTQEIASDIEPTMGFVISPVLGYIEAEVCD